MIWETTMTYTLATTADTAEIEAEMEVSKRWEEKNSLRATLQNLQKISRPASRKFSIKIWEQR
jgi:hypothetical protein